MRAASMLLLVAACGRIDFELRGDGKSSDGSTGDVIDTTCWTAWRAGTLTLSAPEPITVLNTQTYHADPSLAADGLTLYFALGGMFPDIHIATRADLTSPFGAGMRVDELSSAEEEGKVTLSPDQLTAMWSSSRAGSMAYDLWMSMRGSTTMPFAAPPTRSLFGALNDSLSQYDPHLSTDTLRLYYAPEIAAGMQRIVVSTRSGTASDFGTPTAVTDLGGGIHADPSLSPDERVIVFSRKTATPDPFRMFFATRASTTEPFANAQEIPAVNAFAHQQDPALSADGCELFFAAKTGAATPTYLYTSRVQ